MWSKGFVFLNLLAMEVNRRHKPDTELAGTGSPSMPVG